MIDERLAGDVEPLVEEVEDDAADGDDAGVARRRTPR